MSQVIDQMGGGGGGAAGRGGEERSILKTQAVGGKTLTKRLLSSRLHKNPPYKIKVVQKRCPIN